MTTELQPIGNGVNRLMIRDITPLSLGDVNAWLFAIELPLSERDAACRYIMSEGYYAVSNIDYRVTVECTKQ